VGNEYVLKCLRYKCDNLGIHQKVQCVESERQKQSKMFEILMTQWLLVFVEPLLELQPQPVLTNLPVARIRLLGCE